MNLNTRLVASFLVLASSTAAFPTKKNRLSASSSSVVSGITNKRFVSTILLLAATAVPFATATANKKKPLAFSSVLARSLQGACDTGAEHSKIYDQLQARYNDNCVQTDNSNRGNIDMEWYCTKTYGNGIIDAVTYRAYDPTGEEFIPYSYETEGGDPNSVISTWVASNVFEDPCNAFAQYNGDFEPPDADDGMANCDVNVIHDKVITLLDYAIGNCNIVEQGSGDYTHYICDSEVGYAHYIAVNADGQNLAVPYDVHIGATKSSTEYPVNFIQNDLCAAPEIVWGAIQGYLLPEVLDELQPDPTDPVPGLPSAWNMNTWYSYNYEAAITQFDDMGKNWYADYKSGVKDYMSGVTDFYDHLFSKSNNDETSAVEDADVVVAPPAAKETDHGDSADHVTDAADAAATATDAVNNSVKVTVSSASLLSSSMMGIAAAVTTAFVAMA